MKNTTQLETNNLIASKALSSIKESKNTICALQRNKEALSKVAIIEQNYNNILKTGKSTEKEIKSFITKDRSLLEQYYQLRHESYRNENGWTDYNGSENDNDRSGNIIVAVNHLGTVIGGVRLMFSNEAKYLSNEYPETSFTFANLFKQTTMDAVGIYSEVSALIVDKNYRDRNVTKSMLEVVFTSSVMQKCSHVIGIAILPYCRNYRAIFKSIGCEKTYIEMKFPWAEKEMYNYAKMFPVISLI